MGHKKHKPTSSRPARYTRILRNKVNKLIKHLTKHTNDKLASRKFESMGKK